MDTAGTEPSETDKSEAIIRAAVELFSERGYGDTPMPLLAERAGVGMGTVYRYFPSKRALVNAIYRHGKRQLVARLPLDPDTAADAGRLPWRHQFDQWWHALWEFGLADPVLFAFVETHHHDPYLDAESIRLAGEVDAAARAFVARGQQAGAFRTADPALLVSMVMGSFVGVLRSGSLDPALEAPSADAAWSLLCRAGGGA